jgi:hypothetical protein
MASQAELRRRPLSKEEVKKHKDKQVRRSKLITGNIDDEIRQIVPKTDKTCIITEHPIFFINPWV